MFLYYFLGAYTLCGKSGLKPDKSENNSNSRVYLAKLIQFVKFKKKKKRVCPGFSPFPDRHNPFILKHILSLKGLVHTYCRMFVSLEIHRLKPKPQSDGIKR